MGFTLRPPEPKLVESNVQPFDPSIAFKEQIGPYNLEPIGPTQGSFLASSSPFPEDPHVTRWSHFAEDWTTANMNARNILGDIVPDGKQADGLMNMASRWLGWDSPSPGQNQGWSGGKALWVPQRSCTERSGE